MDIWASLGLCVGAVLSTCPMGMSAPHWSLEAIDDDDLESDLSHLTLLRIGRLLRISRLLRLLRSKLFRPGARDILAFPKDPPVLKILRRANFGAGSQFSTDVAKLYGEGSEVLVFLGKRGSKTVRILKNYGGGKTARIRAPYYFKYGRVLWVVLGGVY